MDSQRDENPSETTTIRADDRRNTIEGEASLLNPPVLRKLEHLSVADFPIQPRPSRSSPDPDRISPRGMLTPDPNRQSPADGSSPSTSQVSVGSVPPTLVASMLPAKHFDLTPITRNTSRELYVEDRGEDSTNAALVSPSDDLGELHGEHLAMPSDLAGPAMPSDLTGPALLPHDRWRKNAGSLLLDQEALRQHNASFDTEQHNLADPIQFPARKFYTFTSREQYEEAIQREQQSPGAMQGRASPEGLKPYQPSREDDLEGVGTLPPEALRGIFNRRESTEHSSGSSESHANHRLAQRSGIFLTDPNTSIPSIHMAHHLRGSITSYTDHTENTDDDESLLFVRGVDDEVSLSSRGSSLHLPDMDSEGVAASLPMLNPSTHGGVVVEELNRVIAESSRVAHLSSDDDNEGESPRHTRRKRKQLKKERRKQRAMDWLQSVEANQQEVAEAASSLFLTGRGAASPTNAVGSPMSALSREHPQRRQTISSVFTGQPQVRDDSAVEQPNIFRS